MSNDTKRVRAKITRPDGTVIRLTGSPEDVADVVARVSSTPAPVYVPTVYPTQPFQPYPWATYTTDTIDLRGPCDRMPGTTTVMMYAPQALFTEAERGAAIGGSYCGPGPSGSYNGGH